VVSERRILAIGAAAAAFEAFVWQQGIVGTVLVLAGLYGLVQSRFRLAVVLAVEGFAAFGAIGTNAHIAEARAGQLAAAIRSYAAVTGKCPADLVELAPKHIPGVPRARLALAFSGFIYDARDYPSLTWFARPPFDVKVLRLRDVKCRAS
jgi:hypothetical protein